MSDIVDRIGELVDEQLAQYPERSGYDYNVGAERCPHCLREWHGLKITQRMESMRDRGMYDEDYSYSEDDSTVLCPGSTYDGEWTPPTRRFAPQHPYTLTELAAMRDDHWDLLRDAGLLTRDVSREPAAPPRPRWWYCADASGLEVSHGMESFRPAPPPYDPYQVTQLQVRQQVIVEGEQVGLFLDSEGRSIAVEIHPRSRELLRLAIYAERPPQVGEWREIDNPDRLNR